MDNHKPDDDLSKPDDDQSKPGDAQHQHKPNSVDQSTPDIHVSKPVDNEHPCKPESKSDDTRDDNQHKPDDDELNLESHKHPKSSEDYQNKPNNIDDHPRSGDNNQLRKPNDLQPKPKYARCESQLTAEGENGELLIAN